MRRHVLALLAFAFLAAPGVQAADPAAAPATETTEADDAAKAAARENWFAKAMSDEDEGSCASTVPCCCMIAGGYEGACMTNNDCANLNGTCVSKAKGCGS